MQYSNANKLTYYRLVALWAVAEGFLGGIIHSLQLPVSGLVVGGFAIICIGLIAEYYPVRGAIIKATMLVAIFKMMLSPHSSPLAFLAVFFQGLTGELFLVRTPSRKIFFLLFAILAMVESALQRILIMTLIYGQKIWIAIDAFISGITGSETITRYSYYLAGGYIALHIAAGIAIAVFTSRLIRKVNAEKIHYDPTLYTISETEPTPARKNRKGMYFILYVILLVLFVQSKVHPASPWLPSGTVAGLVIRSLVILLSWNLLFSPLISRLMRQWLERRKLKQRTELHAILQLVPTTEQLIRHCWSNSSGHKGLFRINVFLHTVFVHALSHEKT